MCSTTHCFNRFCIAIVLVFCLTQWSHAFTTLVDDGEHTGLDTSIVMVDGFPAISYFDYSNGVLRYVRAAENHGGKWGEPITVDADPGAGQYTSMAIVNNNPAISYYYWNGTDGMLMYVRATDTDGLNWGVPVVVDDTTTDVGLFTSMVVVDGNPAICYFDSFNSQLRYIRATDMNGVTWGTPVVVDSAVGSGIYPSMAMVDNRPAISYYYDNFPAGEIRYVRALDAGGNVWDAPVTLDSFAQSLLPLTWYDASFPLAVIGGNPAVSYMNWDLAIATHQLNFIRATDSAGTTWGAPVVADSAEAAGTYSSLVQINNLPAIAYYEADNGILKFVAGQTSDGASWNSPQVLDDGIDVGDYCSLTVNKGHAAISYCDWENGDLKYFGYRPPLLKLILPAISSKGRQ